MKYLTILALSLFFGLTFGQPKQKAEVSKAILESIKKMFGFLLWKPMTNPIRYFEIHPCPRHCQGHLGQQYHRDRGILFGELWGFVENIKEKGGQLGIAFAILSTAINEEKNIAYQTGYYRLSSKRADDPNLVVRGYGHLALG